MAEENIWSGAFSQLKTLLKNLWATGSDAAPKPCLS
jgi:hypothetical protein